MSSIIKMKDELNLDRYNLNEIPNKKKFYV
jgi:hypothetical protein